MSKRTRKSRQPSSTVAPAPFREGLASQKETDKWSRGMAILSLAVSLAAIVVSVFTARWGSAYFYADPSQLSYAYTQSNVTTKNDRPASSNTTVAVYNSASTPARS